jgi:histidyl-tRNA synthetase
LSERTFSLPRGMKDIDPLEMAKRLWLHDKILYTTQKHGFQMVEPASIENLETLEAKSGPEIRNEIYYFADKAGRNLGLRFDLTVGMTRMVANRYDLPEPIKICALSGMWRYDEPQFARYRHFYQWDAEIFGTSEQEADAEIIVLGMDVLENVGLRDYEIRISNRRFSEGMLRQLGITADKQIEETIRIIDKLRKISSQELENELHKIGITDDVVQKISDVISLKGSAERVLADLPKEYTKGEMCSKGYDELTRLFDLLKDFGKSEKCVLDLSIVRGIGYYDGIVFEAYDKGGEDVGAIFGGGRYDKLGGLYGKREIPATGVAGGIERLMISLERASLFPELSQSPKVFAAAVDEQSRHVILGLVAKLREKGISCDFDMKKRSLKKQLEYADSMKIPIVIILGPRELEKSVVKVRTMGTRTETEVKISEMTDEVIRKLQ